MFKLRKGFDLVETKIILCQRVCYIQSPPLFNSWVVKISLNFETPYAYSVNI